METTSQYLVVVELLLAFCGGFIFLYRTFQNMSLLYKVDAYIVLLTAISAFWFVLGKTDGRWLSFKATLFVLCLYLSSKYPRQGMLVLAVLALMGFLLDTVANGAYFSKTVGENANQILLFPFTLIFCALFLFIGGKNVNGTLFYFVIIFDIFSAFVGNARGSAISTLLVIILVKSATASRIFLKYGKWIPLAYLILMLISFYIVLFQINWVPASASNIERTSMIFSTINNFFEYPFSGPRAEFDKIVGINMNFFDYSIYDSAKGVDPHSFLLSLWRDEGAILTLLWLLAWFIYWKKLNKLRFWLHDTRIRVGLGMLAISAVQFSLAPPSTGMRLLVALVMGSLLGLAQKRTLAPADKFSKNNYLLTGSTV